MSDELQEALNQMVNSLECGGPAPLWSAATGRRIVESTQAGVAATGSRPAKALPGQRTPRSCRIRLIGGLSHGTTN